MFEIKMDEEGRVRLGGRLDATQVRKIEDYFRDVTGSTVVDLSRLEYISSAGIGVILKTHKRLRDAGGSLSLINVNPRIKTIFHYSGLDSIVSVN